MNNFLRIGRDDSMKEEQASKVNEEESSALAESKLIASNQPKIAIDVDNMLEIIERAENGTKAEPSSSISPNSSSPVAQAQAQKSDTQTTDCNKETRSEANKKGVVTGPDPTKPKQLKAKLLRQQRKAEKLQAKGNSSDGMNEEPTPVKKEPKNVAKDLQAFINETPDGGHHRLKVRFPETIEGNDD